MRVRQCSLRAANISRVSVRRSIGWCSNSSRRVSPKGVPPGSRVDSRSTPARRSLSSIQGMCVLLPAPSRPSSVMKQALRVIGLSLENVFADGAVVRRQVGGKFAGAVAPRYKIQIGVFFGMHGSLQRSLARTGDGSGRQAGAGVGVPGRVALQVLLAQAAPIIGPQAIDHGGIGLQRHAGAQAVDEYARDARPVGAMAGFLFDDRGKDQG